MSSEDRERFSNVTAAAAAAGFLETHDHDCSYNKSRRSTIYALVAQYKQQRLAVAAPTRR